MKSVLGRQQVWAVIALVALVALISAPVYAHRILSDTENDYGSHIQFALDLLQGNPVPSYTLAHPVQQIVLIGLLWLSRGRVDFWQGSILIQVIAQVLAALLLYAWFGRAPGRWSEARRVFWAVTLTVVAPVIALAAVDGRYYFGYIGLANYHNPTVHLLRPFALASFLIALRALDGSRSPWWLVLLSAALVVTSALIKPSYAIIILPALALLAAWRWWKKQPVDFWLLAVGFIAPAGLVLAAQAVVTYGEGGSIAWQPFAVEAGFSSYLGLKFLLSILFPLVVALLYLPRGRKDPALWLGWLVFVVGALQFYLLAETGERLFHGNFRWSGQIGLFLLFAASARFLYRSGGGQAEAASPRPAARRAFDVRTALALAVYLLHLAAGVLYYWHVFSVKGYG